MPPLPLHTYILHTLHAHGHSAYIVGGYVRDTLLKRESKDIDIATSAHPEDILELFPESELVGNHFGVVLVKGSETSIEVATFRTDGRYDGATPEQGRFTDDVCEDMKRRDFTINALYMDVDGRVDECDNAVRCGLSDLKLRCVRVVGSASDRFTEDPLRMMRAIRLACQLDFEIEGRTYIGICQNAALISQVSEERVREELNRILLSGRAEWGINLLVDCHLARFILPDVEALIGVPQNPKYHPEGDVYTHTMRLLRQLPLGCSLTLALAALFHDIGKPATLNFKDGQPTFHGHEEAGATIVQRILTDLKYSNEIIGIVRGHVADHMRFRVTGEMRRGKLYRFLRQDHFAELLALHKLDAAAGSGNMSNAAFVERVLAEVPPQIMRPERLVTGKDLIDLGMMPGPIFSKVLEGIEGEQLEGSISTREQALVFARGMQCAMELGAATTPLHRIIREG